LATHCEKKEGRLNGAWGRKSLGHRIEQERCLLWKGKKREGVHEGPMATSRRVGGKRWRERGVQKNYRRAGVIILRNGQRTRKHGEGRKRASGVYV